MPVVDTVQTFNTGDTVTSTSLNNIMDQSVFVSGAVVANDGLVVSAGGQMTIENLKVTGAKIADGEISTSKIADSNVTTAKIADANVTQAKLAAGVTGNGPAFRAVHSSSSVIATGLPFKAVTLSDAATNTFDTNSNFAGNTFGPTVAGYYQINGNVSFTAVADGALAAIYKNGSIYSYGAPSTSGGVRSNVSDIIYLNGSTDYVNLYVLQTSGSNKTLANDQTFLSGCLIRSA